MEAIIEECKEYLLALGGILLTQADFDAWLAIRKGWFMGKPPYFIYYQRCYYFVYPKNWSTWKGEPYFNMGIHWVDRRTQDCIAGNCLRKKEDIGKWIWGREKYVRRGTRLTLVNFRATTEELF